jgi:hypothetical protein
MAGNLGRYAKNLDEWDWFSIPLDGGDPVPTGAGEALRAAGWQLSIPSFIEGDRILFGGGRAGRRNVWEIHASTDSWKVRGTPRQLTFGTEMEYPSAISATGTMVVETAKLATNFHLISLAPRTGQPTGGVRRLTYSIPDGDTYSIRTDEAGAVFRRASG